MIRLEELKAYQRTRIAGTDIPLDDALAPHAEGDAAADAGWSPLGTQRTGVNEPAFSYPP